MLAGSIVFVMTCSLCYYFCFLMTLHRIKFQEFIKNICIRGKQISGTIND